MPTETQQRRSGDYNDPVTKYARLVLDGTIVQGPYVRLACKRHMDMLDSQGPVWVWNPDKAQRWIDFFPDLLTVEENGETVPFYLLDWEVFVAGSIGGWIDARTGYRLYKRAYIEGAKGCGKSPFAAGIGLLMQVADEEPKAEVYSVAAKKEQAAILFQDAVSMVKTSPLLSTRIIPSGKTPVWQLTHRQSGSVFKPQSADKAKSGLRSHCVLVDELHEHRDRYAMDMATASFKGRRQPLLFVITNSGYDRNSICWEWHQDAIAVVEGTRDNPHFFSFVMALDPDDDPFTDESCWVKTNPGLGITIQESYLRDQVRDAVQVPGRENVVRRLNFCQWTDANVGWMTREAWVRNEEDLTEFAKPADGLAGGGYALTTDFDGAKLFIGVDLSFQFDLTAVAFVFPEGPNLVGWIEYFKPIDTLEAAEKKDEVPYRLWVRQGLITGIPGKIIRYEHIARRIAEVQQQFDLRYAAYDNYAHKTLRDKMAEEGIHAPWIEHPQGFRRAGDLLDVAGRPVRDPRDPKGKALQNPLWMPESVKALETRVIENTLRIQPSPVTRWQVAATAIRDDPAGTGNRVFDKARAVGRIDGVVALAMAVGAAEMQLPSHDLSGFLSNPVVVI